ncbi:MAG: hypothetical protein WC832_11540 [Anaerolineales bacterium]
MALTSKNRNIIIGSALAVIATGAGLLLWTGGESTGSTTALTATTPTTPTATTKTATTPMVETTANSTAVTTPPAPSPSPTPSPESDHSTACADSIGIVPAPATTDAPITVTVKVRGTTASAVKLKYSRRSSGEPWVEKDLSPAGNEGTLAIWQATFNAPHNAGDYDYYSWAIDESGNTSCGGPVGKTLTVHP